MRWSVIALIALGIVAGLCAALLVVSMQASSRSPARVQDAALAPRKEITLLVASSDLPSRAVVVASSVADRTVAPDAVPEGAFTDAVQVIGKVLLVPMAEGQPFTRACFANETAGLRLASALAPGTRAFCITLADSSGVERILYPGSMVDVLTTLKTKTGEDTEQTLSFTLLQNVMVLAVGQQSIVTPGDAAQPALGRSEATLTLLVSSEQAEKLRLAAATGTLSVTMRNPMDSESQASAGVRLGTLAPILASIEERERKQREQREREAVAKLEADRLKYADEMERQRYAMEKTRNETELARERYEQELFKLRQTGEEVTAPRWEMTVLRGGAPEVRSFPIEGSER
ncbi:MAG TPA: Flp pilus assembly protein CpaB [Planctomycetota bacterium]|nr:Flp pilus assembly protein CpaB [Planctomycetota bacterium]